jgi:hypothetical protein
MLALCSVVIALLMYMYSNFLMLISRVIGNEYNATMAVKVSN